MHAARTDVRLLAGEEPGEPGSGDPALGRRVWRAELEISLEDSDRVGRVRLLGPVDHDLIGVTLRFAGDAPAKVVSFAVPGAGFVELLEPEEERHVEILSPERARIVDGRGRRCEVRNQAALVLYVVARGNGHASWLSCAKAIWGRKAVDMRDNFRNNVLYRLDKALRAHGMRDDLTVRFDGTVSFGSGVTWSFDPPSAPPR